MSFQERFLDFWNSFTGTIRSFGLIDLLDVAAVSIIIYYALKLVKETRAVQLLKSIAVIFIVYFIADLPPNSSMITLKFFLGKILDSGLVVLVVLFQPEIRRALEHLGRSTLMDINPFQSAPDTEEESAKIDLIDIICTSAEKLSQTKTGALMVIERDTRLGDIINTGTIIDAKASLEMMGNIFFVNTPLHDGALIIRDSRLYAAGCFLPLSENYDIARDFGTRHRAALGVSEISDAIVVIVSEETGNISVAYESRIQRGLSKQNLKKLLTAKLISAPKTKRKIGFNKSAKIQKKEQEEKK